MKITKSQLKKLIKEEVKILRATADELEKEIRGDF